MEAKFTKGPYQREGRSIYKLVDNPEPKRGHPGQLNLWLAGVSPCGMAVDTAELEAVATLFQASPMLYEALEKRCRFNLSLGHCRKVQCLTCSASIALRAARGEK